MITRLRAGQRVLLPSGNIILLLRPLGSEWVCEYTSYARSRGEVEFSGVWLRRVGVLA